MAIGHQVNKSVLDMKAADAVLSLRAAFNKAETLAKWLSNNPEVEGVDPLVEDFGYTTDEAYLIRVTFESFYSIRTNNESVFETARKITGLE